MKGAGAVGGREGFIITHQNQEAPRKNAFKMLEGGGGKTELRNSGGFTTKEGRVYWR